MRAIGYEAFGYWEVNLWLNIPSRFSWPSRFQPFVDQLFNAEAQRKDEG
ncbi:hypothetical protein JOD20_000388 [Herpetosiphon giganteus]|nr:hypothetical protein [Herpetosiphon giganteus]